MVHINLVRASNEQGKNLKGLVAVFVGGTGGIGESTAREFFHRTTQPRAYIVGRHYPEPGVPKQPDRNEERANRIVKELKELNPDGEAFFLQKDLGFLRNVDEVCDVIKRRERKINCLVVTAGYMTLHGRMETEEGIDRKMCLNYYSRIRWALNLMPLLEAASNANELSRVLTVLAAGSEGEVRLDDLDLKHSFTLHACLAHCVIMTDFAIDELSKRYPGTSFSHSYPGTVKTGIANELIGPARLVVKLMYSVMIPWIINVQEAGARHFFQMTSKCYPSANGGVGLPQPDSLDVFKAMDGTPGGGAYLLDWDSKTCGNQGVVGKYRKMGVGPKVWDHTMQIFAQAEQSWRKDSKRPASSDAEGNDRSIPDPPGWRAG